MAELDMSKRTPRKRKATNTVSLDNYKSIVKKGESEHTLQKKCVRWFDLTYPRYKNLLFAVPNGFHVGGIKGVPPKEIARRHAMATNKLKAEGLRAGIPDLILVFDSKLYPIELKKHKTGKRSEAQKKVHKDWKEYAGVEVATLDSFEDFTEYVGGIIKNK
jgi:hypothetical protein